MPTDARTPEFERGYLRAQADILTVLEQRLDEATFARVLEILGGPTREETPAEQREGVSRR